ncbi:MAG: class I SAM-dependent methyltransferase [Phycisphaeraceae bacterium]|nr:class I SAM-dependent methyltransferase [Phycisphaeraceae bacterium]
MLGPIKRACRGVFHRLGYDIVERKPAKPAEQRRYPPDFSDEEIETLKKVEPYSMTGIDRLCIMTRVARYIVDGDIPGDCVECGVWRGGSMMAVAYTLLAMGRGDRDLHLYDTYTGMVEPSEADVDHTGKQAKDKYQQLRRDDGGSEWCIASRGEVEHNLAATGYDMSRVHLIEGRVEDTIPQSAPERIAILRLDTDWYESTRHELEHLFPRLSPGGVLIVDDYGHWQGQRKAVDEYIQQNKLKLMLCRIDPYARMAIKLPDEV